MASENTTEQAVPGTVVDRQQMLKGLRFHLESRGLELLHVVGGFVLVYIPGDLHPFVTWRLSYHGRHGSGFVVGTCHGNYFKTEREALRDLLRRAGEFVEVAS